MIIVDKRGYRIIYLYLPPEGTIVFVYNFLFKVFIVI